MTHTPTNDCSQIYRSLQISRLSSVFQLSNICCVSLSSAKWHQQRRGSMSRRDSVSIAEMLALPSVPLKPVGDPGPPRIIECQDNYNAIEGSFIPLNGTQRTHSTLNITYPPLLIIPYHFTKSFSQLLWHSFTFLPILIASF